MGLSEIGAYVRDDDPSVVFVWATAWAPGGKLSALRRDGVWRPSSLTIGDLEVHVPPFDHGFLR
jgi:hypothetical protein